jgi:phosphoenolpyruvate-protein phosphotransferase (PTS system enzyme I)
MSFQIFGLPVSPGVAIGRAVLIASSRIDVAHYFIAAEQVEDEIDRLRSARDAVASELGLLQRDLLPDSPPELSALLDVHIMLLRDETLTLATKVWIQERHYNAEWALSAQLEVLARQFDEMQDDYLRERKADLEQVVERLLRTLQRDVALTTASMPLQPVSPAMAVQPRDFAGADPLVLIASDIAPADMMQFDSHVFSGFVTDVGGKTSHTAIVARSMNIAAVVGAREASHLIQQDDWVIIDGDSGVVLVNPCATVLDEYRFRQRQHAFEREKLSRLTRAPAITLDGHPVQLHANIELPSDAVTAGEAGAVGIGLFRSEFLFMNRGGELPTEEEQFQAYKAAVLAMHGGVVTIRTVDIGADKSLERLSTNELRHEHALNPALGLRAIRWSLSEPSMFRQQLRAILRASAFGKVRLLIPMVAHLSEIRQVREVLTKVRQQLTDAGHAYAPIELGAMIEVPAAALMLPLMLPLLDFISIGTNDLIQYTLAIDRTDETVSHLYDPWHPAVLGLVAQSIAQANQAQKSVTICGEMAGDPQFTEMLLAMGLRSFSMHPSTIATVKQRILQTDTRKLAPHIGRIVACADPEAAYRALVAKAS